MTTVVDDAVWRALRSATVLAFDLDEVTFDIRTELERFALLMGINRRQIDRSKYDFGLSTAEMSDLLEFAIPQGLFLNAAAMPSSVAAINEIAARGYRVHYVTHRGAGQSTSPSLFQKVQDDTIAALLKAGLPNYRSVHFCSDSKLPKLQELGADIVVDDYPSVVSEAHNQRHLRGGLITGLLFNAEYHDGTITHPHRLGCISHLLDHLLCPPKLD